jgi:hypothetical protein
VKDGDDKFDTEDHQHISVTPKFASLIRLYAREDINWIYGDDDLHLLFSFRKIIGSSAFEQSYRVDIADGHVLNIQNQLYAMKVCPNSSKLIPNSSRLRDALKNGKGDGATKHITVSDFVDLVDRPGNTPLHSTIKRNSAAAFDKLIEHHSHSMGGEGTTTARKHFTNVCYIELCNMRKSCWIKPTSL